MADVETAALRIVEQALAYPETDRAAFLDHACADAPELRRRVDRLLALDDTGFRLMPTESFAGAPIVPEDLPDRVGPYRITGRIGHGGMGWVVKGERDDGVFQQVVAIKLIRRSLSDARTRARFDQERRILGRLIHPGIARILDGGDAEGRPWLAMDYLDGEPVTLALAKRNADLAATLDAFEAICEAVGHAHRNLVVHADIKPSNVVMSDTGVVKLLDFGIARLIVDLDPDEEEEPYPLTRGYAAPERSDGRQPAIVGDVYSLGVLLHEMLTGELPEAGRLPSSLAKSRIASARLSGDLDAILAKALAIDPTQRYQDVAALVGDVRAVRSHMPVSARQPAGWRYLSTKFLRRHRTGAMVATAVMLLLTATTVISTLLYTRAETARIEADRRFLEGHRLVRYLLFDHYEQLAASPGTVEARVRLAETAGAYLDQLRQVADAPADLRLDSARGYRRLALVQGVSGVSSLGDIAAAQASLDKAAALLATLMAERPDDADVLSEMGWVEAHRWSLAADDAQGPERIERSARLFETALRRNPRLADAQIGSLTTERNRGFDLIWGANRPADALIVLRNALARLRALSLPTASQEDARRLEFALLNRIGDATYFAGDESGALIPYREAAALAQREAARRETPYWLAALAETRWNIGSTIEADGPALAEVRLGKVAIERALAFGPDANAEKWLFILLADEANRLRSLQRFDEAVEASRRSIDLRSARLTATPNDPIRSRDLAIALPNHAETLAAAGRRDDACTQARRAVALFERMMARRELGTRDQQVDVPIARQAQARLCRR